MEKINVENFCYDLQDNFRLLGPLSIAQETHLYNVCEVGRAIFTKSESVPEMEFSKDLFKLLCGNEVKITNGWMDEEEYAETITDEAMKVDIATEMFINPSNLFQGGKIRPDVVFRKGLGNYVIFEIDSFQYHSNQQQLMKDKVRERAIQSLGHPVFRFAAKEVLNDSWGVAIEAAKILETRGFITLKHKHG